MLLAEAYAMCVRLQSASLCHARLSHWQHLKLHTSKEYYNILQKTLRPKLNCLLNRIKYSKTIHLIKC